MAFNYDREVPSKYIYLPKIGEETTFQILEIRKVDTGQDRFHFQGKVEEEVFKKDPATGELIQTKETVTKSIGWHIECDLPEGKILSVTSFAAFLQVFKKNDVQDGDVITVNHIDKGEWKVTKLEEANDGGGE